MLNIDPSLDIHKSRLGFNGSNLYITWAEANGSVIQFSDDYVKKHTDEPVEIISCQVE